MSFREKWERFKAKVAGARKSITIWFNAFAVSAIPAIDFLKELVPQVQQYVDDHIFKNLMLGVIVLGNVMLRFKTKTDLSDK